MLEKECSVCHVIYNITKFYKDKRNKSGITYACKNCLKWERNNRDKVNTRRKLYDKKKSEDGLCLRCNEKSIDCNYDLCEKHFLQYTSYRHLGTRKHWKLLKDLHIKQKEKCALSGIKIQIGKNASIDHIKSRKNFPDLSNNLDNIQWVDIKVNLAKRELSEDEFLKMIENIYKTRCV